MVGFLGREILDYTLTRKLGEGAAAVVYLGEHAELGTRCVFKIVHPELGRSPNLLVRLHAHLAALHRFGHPALPRVMNIGRLVEGELFYQIEHVAGVDLGARIAEGPLPHDRLGDIFEPLSAALAMAHDRGLVHGGIKPGNVMVDERRDGSSSVRLLDLGLLTGADAMTSGAPLDARGDALRFAAPEQRRGGEAVDARADIYSFAATVYAAAVGTPPGDIGPAAQPERPPRALEAALGRCLDEDPAKRPETIAAAWSSIRDALDSRGGARRAARATLADPRWRGRATGALYVAAFLLAALAGLGLAWFLA